MKSIFESAKGKGSMECPRVDKRKEVRLVIVVALSPEKVQGVPL